MYPTMFGVEASITEVNAIARVLASHGRVQCSYGLIDLVVLFSGCSRTRLELDLLCSSRRRLVLEGALRFAGSSSPCFLAAADVAGGVADALAVSRPEHLAVEAEDLPLQTVPPLDVVLVRLPLHRHALVENCFELPRRFELRLVTLVTKVRIEQLMLVVEGEDLRVEGLHLRVESGDEH
jgi:hypothetical protein